MHGLSLAGGKGGEKRYDPDHAVCGRRGSAGAEMTAFLGLDPPIVADLF